MKKKLILLFLLIYIALTSSGVDGEIGMSDYSLKNKRYLAHKHKIYKESILNRAIKDEVHMKMDIIENFPYLYSLPALPIIPPGGRVIKIGLYQNLKEVYISCNGNYSIYSSSGKIIIDENQVLSIKIPMGIIPSREIKKSGEIIKIKPQKMGNILNLIIKNTDYSYRVISFRGNFNIFLNSRGFLTVINELSLNEYLAGVVPNEMPSSFPLEALKAQSIVARTYTLTHLGKHKEEGFDLCSTVHCQVYGGLNTETITTNQAVRETTHKMVFYGDNLADTVYHSTCGGLTANVENVWQLPPVDYLKSVPTQDSYNTFQSEEDFKEFINNPVESFCQESRLFRWEKSYTREDLQNLLSESLPIILNYQAQLGDLIDISIERRSEDGRAQTLLIKGSLGEYRVKKDKIRWITSKGKINKDALPSTLFYIDKPEENIICFKGGGWGHGIGLCQFCAKGMASGE